VSDHTDAAKDRESVARTISVVGLQVSQAADELGQAAQRLIDAESRVLEAEARWHAAQEQLEQGAVKNAELLEMLSAARNAQAEAEERQRRSEQRLQIAVERTRTLEERVRDLEARQAGAPDVTVVLDDERTALQESIAGEVRRPLASIMGLALALKHGDLRSGEGVEMVRQLATNARKLDRLVGEMLDVERIASGDFEPTMRRTDLEALVRRVVDESTDLQNREVIVDTEHVALEVDPALTEQIVEMLLANAGRRTTPGNPVWVKLNERTDGVTISVEDTGPEVPPGLRGTLLAAASAERSVARSKTKAATGLSLLARLATIQGGRAWVEARPGGGASFRVFLPAPAPPAGDDDDADLGSNVLPLRRTDRTASPSSTTQDEAEARALALARAMIAADGEHRLSVFGELASPTGDPLSDRLIAGAAPETCV